MKAAGSSNIVKILVARSIFRKLCRFLVLRDLKNLTALRQLSMHASYELTVTLTDCALIETIEATQIARIKAMAPTLAVIVLVRSARWARSVVGLWRQGRLLAGLCAIVSWFKDKMQREAAEEISWKSPRFAGEASPYCHWVQVSITHFRRPSFGYTDMYRRDPPPSRLPAAFWQSIRLKSSCFVDEKHLDGMTDEMRDGLDNTISLCMSWSNAESFRLRT